MAAQALHLPNEILEQIFRHVLLPVTAEELVLEDQKPEDLKVPKDRRHVWLVRFFRVEDPWGVDNRLHDRFDLVPISHVCRKWNLVANKILYEEIQLGQWYWRREPNESFVSKYLSGSVSSGPTDADALAQTLASTNHGFLVRRLSLYTEEKNVGEVRTFVQIVRHCPHLTDLRLRLGHVPVAELGDVLEGLFSILSSEMKELRTLKVRKVGLIVDGMESVMLKDKRLLELLQQLPKIERVEMPALYQHEWHPELMEYAESRGIRLKTSVKIAKIHVATLEHGLQTVDWFRD